MNAWEFASDHQEERMELLAFRPKTADTDGEDSSMDSMAVGSRDGTNFCG